MKADTKRELTCVTCPFSCRLEAEGASPEELAVTGNRCKRGLAYAREELFAPKRLVTTTIPILTATAGNGGLADLPKRLPCRTRSAFPRERIPELLESVRGIEVGLPVRAGDAIRVDLLGTGIDLIATRSLP